LPIILNWAKRSDNHTGTEKCSAVGSSGEYWSMYVSTNQHFVEMRDLNKKIVTAMIVVKSNRGLTTCDYVQEELRANNVPAAAVRR